MLKDQDFFNVLTRGGESTIGLKCADDGLIRNPEIKTYVGLEHFDGCRKKFACLGSRWQNYWTHQILQPSHTRDYFLCQINK